MKIMTSPILHVSRQSFERVKGAPPVVIDQVHFVAYLTFGRKLRVLY